MKKGHGGSDTIVSSPEVGEIGRLVRTGTYWTLVSTVLRYLLGMLVTSILARKLSPADYGILGMVTTLAAFLQLFADMGLSWATIQKRDLTQGQVHNLFWLNSGCGVLLWGLAAMAGPALAWFYHKPELVGVSAVMGIAFLFTGFSVQPMSLLKRKMNFGRLALAEFGGTAIGSLSALALAFTGLGYWTLIWQVISTQFFRMVFLLVLSGYVPGKFRRDQGTLPLVQFGGWMAATGVVSYLTHNMESILVGRLYGDQQLGLYSRALFLMSLPMVLSQALESSMVPALSAIQHKADEFEVRYRKALQLVVITGFPISIGLYVVAEEVVKILYGSRWAGVVPLFKWLLFASFLHCVTRTFGWVYVAKGQGKALVSISLVTTLIWVLGYLIAASRGPVAIAAAHALILGLQIGPLAYLAHRVGGMALSKTLREIAPTIGMSLLLGGVAVLSGWLFGWFRPSWRFQLVGKLLGGTGVYLVLVYLKFPDLFKIAQGFLFREKVKI